MTFPMPYIAPFLPAAGEIVITRQPEQETGSAPWAIGAVRSIQSGDYLNGSYLTKIRVPETGSELFQLFVATYETFGNRRYTTSVFFSGTVTNADWSGLMVGSKLLSRSLFTTRQTGSGSWTDYTRYQTSVRLISDTAAWPFSDVLNSIPANFPAQLSNTRHAVEVIA